MYHKTSNWNQSKSYYKSIKRRNNYASVIAVIVLVGVWYIFIGRDLLSQMDARKGNELPKKVYYEFTCSEANLAKLVGMTWNEDIASASTESNSKEADAKHGIDEDTLWYEKYYDKLETLGVSSLKIENAFNALSSQQLMQVFYELTGKDILIEEKNQLQLYEVLQYYKNVLKECNQAMQYKTLTILSTPTDSQDLSAWQVATSEGKYCFEGLVIDPLKNKTVQVAYFGEELLGVTEIISNQCILDDCKVIEVEDEMATIEVAGLELQFKNKALKKEDIMQIGSVMIEEGKVIDFTAKGSQQLDTLVGVSSNEILLEKAGSFGYDQVVIEDQTGQNQYHELGDLVFGLRVAYSQREGKITRLQVVGGSTLQEIRVLISSTKEGYTQSDVALSVSADYDLLYNGVATTLAKGETWKASQFDWQDGVNVIRMIPRDEKSQIILNSIEKSGNAPAYLGILEINKVDGGYQLINEVNMESYVAGVLPSEMPTSYGIEALKAQAVAIRTYGMACMESGKFMAYGAHVDDTTASQVYNQTPTNEIAMDAAKQTAGLVLKSEGKLISNKFFATSCGYTANFGEVWAGQDFPSNTPSYLVSRQQYLGDHLVSSLQDETHFKEFITLGAEDMDAFDEDSPWFRWQVTLTGGETQKLIQTALESLVQKYSSLITITSQSGKNENNIEALGNLCALEVLQRGEGGNIMSLALQFEEGKAVVETEYLIRSLFASNKEQDLTVVRNNQSTVSQMTLLPSAFFTIEQSKDESGKLSELTLLGGGNGHGVGLSQDGAKGMAERGYSYKDILMHYYNECEIVQG
ncbi:MAG: SpoIID/LytB domain-containing protein [Cellulosilyticum sp.]|nr:SpoIID/LytB domain-containing protein [Cellulosilyticum sp.]